jgi:transcriptional regulator with XRE-family HTH domain
VVPGNNIADGCIIGDLGDNRRMVKARETGNKLYTWRKAQGRTQVALAKAAGLSQSVISELENLPVIRIRDVHPDTLKRLADALGLGSADMLLDEDQGDAPAGDAPRPVVRPAEGQRAADGGDRQCTIADDLDSALTSTFSAQHHRISDPRAVLDALAGAPLDVLDRLIRAARGRQTLREMTGRWMDAAAALRAQGVPVTMATLLFATTISGLPATTRKPAATGGPRPRRPGR